MVVFWRLLVYGRSNNRSKLQGEVQLSYVQQAEKMGTALNATPERRGKTIGKLQYYTVNTGRTRSNRRHTWHPSEPALHSTVFIITVARFEFNGQMCVQSGATTGKAVCSP